jgi:predicted RND superfamily exporter protein
MLENDSRSLVAGIGGCVLVFLLTLPSLASVASHLREPKPKSNIYEDKDGIATEKSVAEYSAKIPKIFLFVFAVLGLGTSIALAVLETLAGVDLIETWLNVAQWVRKFT